MGLSQCLLSLYTCLETVIDLVRMRIIKPKPGFSASCFLFRPRSPLTETAWDPRMRLQQQQER